MAASYNYVNAVDPNLMCCICRSPFVEPTTTRTCAHTFCYECIVHSIQITPQCPVDRSPLAPEDLYPADPVVRNLVDELIVECPERKSGCRHTCQRQLLASHMKDSCEFVKAPSDAEGGDATVSRKGSDRHDHDAEEDESSGDQEAVTAPDETSSQPPHEVGIARLSEENTLLKMRIDALEGLVRIMTKEMQAVKNALGPWFRPEPYAAAPSYFLERGDSRQPPAPAEPDEFDFPQSSEVDIRQNVYVQPESRQDMLSPHPDQMPHVPRHPVHFPLIDPATPESYAHLTSLTADQYPINPFAGDLDPSSPRSHAPPSHQPPGLAASASNPSYASPVPSVPSASTSVAPLNLSTTLYGALSGLHESIVSVSTNVDSLARRTEITMNTDHAMMAEEMRVVKAAVHGLRMQVHAIMMDRNAQVTGRASGVAQSSLDGPYEGSPGPGWPILGQYLSPPRPFPPPLSTSIPKL
ncbi:hypothetical protein GLOTRDRAFT_79656 [Gloeophyllum trabeum ATCC 11539]|uniref:RING-type domain-containing protein n=1 Tax=Gloeophyllum trabeum (strain ATCC 11539 / FP-39264 / Madison 617) TaxID=670483 RepID=S7PY44_GLOTA|nr:uncharacterized protein GLOTRDRAFT_79656 [Gloeophyllum trabeum ATCC 11539]EPQ52551.1 hypothetical protein GLOTRDRAFT_79656 [Gloeophyllum trabeum ATCC 11539]